jgi:hypothetical protein
MKNKMLLTLALGLAAGASSLMAGTVDVYITGSTAFRGNVYTACTKLYSTIVTNPLIAYADINDGGDGAQNSKTPSWVMSGTPITTLTNIQGNTLVIHGNFTGSIQGMQTVEAYTKLDFAALLTAPTNGNYASSYVQKAPTIGFSDASRASTPYSSTYANAANTLQEAVCVQPFVIAKSVGTGAAANAMTNISNLSWEQLEYGIPIGRIPLSAWTYKSADTNTWIYLCQRTLDSGTRRIETAQQYFQYGDAVGVYLYDYTNSAWYLPSATNNFALKYPSAPYGVIGTEGPGYQGANLIWTYGYIGGGDIKNTLNLNAASTTNLTAIAYLSIGDAQGVGPANWANIVSFNGLWPTTAGANIRSNTVTSTGFTGAGTNDFSPILNGYYPCWGNEVLVHLVDPTGPGDQNISSTQLGNNTTPGSFLGVFNAQTLLNTNLNGVPLVGSIENEIELSKTNLATGIRLSEMKSNRGSDGGTIAPF